MTTQPQLQRRPRRRRRRRALWGATTSSSSSLVCLILIGLIPRQQHQQVVRFCESFAASSVNLRNQHQNFIVRILDSNDFFQRQTTKILDKIHSGNNNNSTATATTSTSSSSRRRDENASASFWSSLPRVRFRREDDFSSVLSELEFPASHIEDTHEQYLRRHQIVKKRRVVKRMVEIATILAGQILRPLLCSIVKTKSATELSNLFLQSPQSMEEEWDAFWRSQSKHHHNDIIAGAHSYHSSLRQHHHHHSTTASSAAAVAVAAPGTTTTTNSTTTTSNSGPLTNAQRVAKGVPALGPTFVKMAHILATRPDILHVPLAEALGELQQNGAPPFDDLTAKRIVRTEIQQTLRLRRSTSRKNGSLSRTSSQRPRQRSRSTTIAAASVTITAAAAATPAMASTIPVAAAADTTTTTTSTTTTTTPNQSHYIRNHDDLRLFMDSLSDKPVAAGAVAQVYKGHLPGYGPVAVKVLRPGIRAKVERDATLFHSVATWVELWNNNTLLPLLRRPKQPNSKNNNINNNDNNKFGSMQLVQAVDEFTARVLEDMDFRREAENMKVFAQLYDSQRGSSPTVKVVVPEVIPELCTDRILIMEWLEGTKLTECSSSNTVVDGDSKKKKKKQERLREKEKQENLQLIVQAIECTISQLIDHGVLHGDPNSANLLKVKHGVDGRRVAGSSNNQNNNKKKKHKKNVPELGYLDFGLVSYVPQKFRDGIVCAVVQLVFARNIHAVADLCGDLGLLPEETLQDPRERKRFMDALQNTTNDILIWPIDDEGMSTAVPKVRFENLLPAVSKLIRSFEFVVPPYFLNNIRALATLEGMALKLDPQFNVLRVVYPYSINRLMRNPSVSQRVQETFVEICRSPETRLISPKRVRMLLNDWALWTGYRKRKVFWDLVTSAGGRRVTPVILHNWYLNRVRNVKTLWSQSRRVVQKIATVLQYAIPIGERGYGYQHHGPLLK